MKQKIEAAIRETLVVENKQSIWRAVEKILLIVEQEQALRQANVSGLLPPVDDLMQLIEKQCAEHIAIGGIRFYGTSWAQLVAIFEKFGYERKIPF